MFGNAFTSKFCDIFPDVETFKESYQSTSFGERCPLKELTLEVIYYGLYSKYGNSSFAGFDDDMNEYRTMSKVFDLGPTFEKKMELQELYRTIELKDIKTMQWTNHVYNPSTPLQEGEELFPGINEQTQNFQKPNDLVYAAQIWELLSKQGLDDFIKEFKVLFLNIVFPSQIPYYYFEEDER